MAQESANDRDNSGQKKYVLSYIIMSESFFLFDYHITIDIA